MSESTYDKLKAPFEVTHTRKGAGNLDLEYITGEQCQDRLNTVLGYEGWSFRIVEHGIHSEADEVWVLGELTAGSTHRQQFGSQKIKRSRTGGQPIEIGFDLKGATTDALKRCAVGIGVALYLYDKEERAAEQTPAPTPLRTAQPIPSLTCEDCDKALTETTFRDGTAWSPEQLAAFGQKKYGRTLCMGDYRKAKAAAEANA